MALTIELYPYQRDAFDKFLSRGSLLLAFDTGLGKTATAIALAEDLLERREVRKVLLVVPANLKLQWARALASFTDLPVTQVKVKDETITIPAREACVVVDGTPAQREAQFRAARSRITEYVIVGYEQVVSDFRTIRELGCDFVVLDEASAIKTPGTKRTRAVKRHLKVPYRLALTATPIENRPEEVFSIMQWVDEEVLGRYDLFDRAYINRNHWGAVEAYKNLDVLHGRLDAAMVRKTRHDPDVAPFMPDVTRETWEVRMDTPTRSAYKQMAADLLTAYNEVGDIGGTFDVHAHYGAARADPRGDKSGLGRLMSIRGCMEMLLAHPSLIQRSADLYATTDNQGSRYAAELIVPFGRGIPHTTPKLDYYVRACDEILTSDPRAKILTFTFYKGMLPIMAERLRDIGYEVTLYDGDMSVREKEASVQRFKTRPEVRVFLSSHAGAYGTDLPEANWLVNYDVPWGAGKARQINGRHVRASSEFDEVHVRNMVVAGTTEALRLATVEGFKGGLSDRVIDGAAGSELVNEIQGLKAHAEEVLEELAGQSG